MENLIINPKFRDIIPPLSPDSFELLEQNILDDGEVREPIVAWGDTIIDGHHRWKIIQKHPEIHYTIKRVEFNDNWDAIAWMCKNQIGRRNLSDEQKTYLIGKQYEAQKNTIGNHAIRGDDGKYLSRQYGDLGGKPTKTKDVIAKEHGIGGTTVERAERFAKCLDSAEKVSPGIKDSILSGSINVPKTTIAEIRNLPDEKKVEAVEAIKRGDIDAAREITKPEPKEHEEDTDDFTVDDLRDLIDGAVESLNSALEQHLVYTHKDMLKSVECRESIIEGLKIGISVIQGYMKHVRSVKG